MFDPIRISQVVINLLSNAIKYGEGKPIRISIEKQGEKTKISVIDQGKAYLLRRSKNYSSVTSDLNQIHRYRA